MSSSSSNESAESTQYIRLQKKFGEIFEAFMSGKSVIVNSTDNGIDTYASIIAIERSESNGNCITLFNGTLLRLYAETDDDYPSSPPSNSGVIVK